MLSSPIFVFPSYWYTPPFHYKKLSKLKIPLKIKIFLWFLQKGVVLTKDNLTMRNCKGNQNCICCNMNKTIQHLFIDCPLTKTIWRIIFFATNLTNQDLLTIYLVLGFAIKIRGWEVWSGLGLSSFAGLSGCRNDVIFNKLKSNSIMQVIFRGAFWLRFWTHCSVMSKLKSSFRR